MTAEIAEPREITDADRARWAEHAHVFRFVDDQSSADEPPIAVATRLYVDGVKVSWWGGHLYPLGRWNDGVEWHPTPEEIDEFTKWTLTGGIGQEVRLTLHVPAEHVEIDGTIVRLWGLPVYTPPFHEEPLDERLQAAQKIGPAAPVKVVVQVEKVIVGPPETALSDGSPTL